jgi:hypothetical protein
MNPHGKPQSLPWEGKMRESHAKTGSS